MENALLLYSRKKFISYRNAFVYIFDFVKHGLATKCLYTVMMRDDVRRRTPNRLGKWLQNSHRARTLNGG